MSEAAVYLLLPESMADWEPGYAVAGLRHWARVPVPAGVRLGGGGDAV